MYSLNDIKFNIDDLLCIVKGEKVQYDEAVNRICAIMTEAQQHHNKMMFIGNGGSAGIAIHMTTDYLKNGNMITHSMHDPATLTCLANDFGYELVFSKQIEYVAQKGDILVAISSSGNSPNIINAVEKAKKNGCSIITLSGFEKSNKIFSAGEVNFYVHSMSYGMVESIHQMILQYIVDKFVSNEKD